MGRALLHFSPRTRSLAPECTQVRTYGTSKPLVILVLAAIASAARGEIDPRGPIDNPGILPIVDAEGVHAPGFTFDPSTCSKPRPWQARWIWLPLDARKVAATAFRKEVVLADTPRRVAAWLSADVKYRLYVNGRLAARGPVNIGTDYAGGSTERWFYDYRDLTPLMHKGANGIALEVFQHWPIGFTVSRGQPGLIFEKRGFPAGRLAANDRQRRDVEGRARRVDFRRRRTHLRRGPRAAGLADGRLRQLAVEGVRSNQGPLEPLGGQRDSSAHGSPLSGPAD